MNDLMGQPGVLTATVHVTRKETGKTETFTLIGTPVEEETKKEDDNGGHALHSSS